jgi:hypothetical protein
LIGVILIGVYNIVLSIAVCTRFRKEDVKEVQCRCLLPWLHAYRMFVLAVWSYETVSRYWGVIEDGG